MDFTGIWTGLWWTLGAVLMGAALFIFPLISAPVAFVMGYLGIGTYLNIRAGREMSEMDLRGYSLSAGALCALVLMLLLRWLT